jgi:hypothetical protein
LPIIPTFSACRHAEHPYVSSVAFLPSFPV